MVKLPFLKHLKKLKKAYAQRKKFGAIGMNAVFGKKLKLKRIDFNPLSIAPGGREMCNTYESKKSVLLYL